MPSLAWLTENQPNSSTQISSPFFLQSYDTYPSVSLSSFSLVETRLRVVPHFSSGIVERAKRERAWKSPHARKGDTRWGERKMTSPHRVSPFLAWGDFHAHSRLARSTIPEEKWGTTRSLGGDQLSSIFLSRKGCDLKIRQALSTPISGYCSHVLLMVLIPADYDEIKDSHVQLHLYNQTELIPTLTLSWKGLYLAVSRIFFRGWSRNNTCRIKYYHYSTKPLPFKKGLHHAIWYPLKS